LPDKTSQAVSPFEHRDGGESFCSELNVYDPTDPTSS
ncbi:hypothetical protein A2U01_0085483, partial [Trifolium medium]|nr:hypothetical protein [Trifolium medium]